MARIARAVAAGYPHTLRREAIDTLRKHERIGRPLGNERFVDKLEVTLGRILRRQKPGRKTGVDEQH